MQVLLKFLEILKEHLILILKPVNGANLIRILPRKLC